ncbi:MAG: NAD(P)H-dependent oxidoreductase [Thermodesulfobacteriota bacterium]
MRWYVLLAHPNTESFNHAVCRAFVHGLDDAGAKVDVNDLYASRFNPIMAGKDFNQFVEDGTLPADILAEQAKVDRADGLALIYPVWWNEAPAILKGWIDRVLSKGWAYDVTPAGEFLALLKLKKVIIFNTADNPSTLLEETGLNNATRLTKDAGTFGFCGVKTVQHHILGDVGSDNAARLAFLKKAGDIGRSQGEK